MHLSLHKERLLWGRKERLAASCCFKTFGLLGGTLALAACDVKDTSEIVDEGESKTSSTSKDNARSKIKQRMSEYPMD